jgi:hypothetical protein
VPDVEQGSDELEGWLDGKRAWDWEEVGVWEGEKEERLETDEEAEWLYWFREGEGEMERRLEMELE